jgi:hypothetical protein
VRAQAQGSGEVSGWFEVGGHPLQQVSRAGIAREATRQAGNLQ